MKRRKTLIDWQRLTLNLRSKGTLSSFAAEFGCDSMTLQRLARGDVEEPRFELGLKLLNAHLDLFQDQHHQLLRGKENPIVPGKER
jgi:hypothetical protein